MAARSAPHAPIPERLFRSAEGRIVHKRNGNHGRCILALFMFVHFGKHAAADALHPRNLRRFGEGGLWDWASTSADVDRFRAWLHAHTERLRRANAPGGFGNHRKYESLDAKSENGTGAVVESYVNG